MSEQKQQPQREEKRENGNYPRPDTRKQPSRDGGPGKK